MTDDFEEWSRLFDSARSTGGIEFVYAMTRVEGMSFDRPDPLAAPHTTNESLTPEARNELLKMLENVLRCAQGLRYRGHIDAGTPEQLEEVATASRDHGYTVIADALEAGGSQLDRLLDGLFCKYQDQRRAALSARRLYKLGGFDVLELIVDDETGLMGFRVHFSNDEHAEFQRTETSTSPLNITFDHEGGVVLNVGDLSALRQEWRVNGRPLYELGIPGRYNAPGEWKPLVYPGEWDKFAQRAKTASERPEVQGGLLYCFLTAHPAFEFAMRTSVELPHDATSFGDGRLELIKIPPPLGGEVVYDGTVLIRDPEAGAIEEAIALVQALMNEIAFAFDASVTWVPKYSTHHSGGSRATPSEEDLGVLDHLLGAANRVVIDEAIDWYNRGRSSANVFVAFLCAYISLESTVAAIWDGDIEVRVAAPSPPKAQRKADVAGCIEELRELNRETDPAQFVQHAYFECVIGLTRRVKEVTNAVFGPDSAAVTSLFTKRDGTSLASLRSLLAHGGLSLADPHARELVRSRLPEIQDVAREFLLRVSLDLLPTEEVPEWSGLHRFGVTMDDPRATLCTSSLDHLPASDWRIKPEWIE